MKLSIILTILLLSLQETPVAPEQPATAPLAAGNSAAATESSTVIATDTGVAAQPAAQTWTMRYQFHPGQQLRYQSKQQMTLEAQVGENQRVDVSQVRQIRRYAVSETTGDLSRLSMQFEDVWMHRQVDQEPPVEFRSSMKPGEVPEVFRNVAHSLRGQPRFFRSPASVGLLLHRQNRQSLRSPSHRQLILHQKRSPGKNLWRTYRHAVAERTRGPF